MKRMTVIGTTIGSLIASLPPVCRHWCRVPPTAPRPEEGPEDRRSERGLRPSRSAYALAPLLLPRNVAPVDVGTAQVAPASGLRPARSALDLLHWAALQS